MFLSYSVLCIDGGKGPEDTLPEQEDAPAEEKPADPDLELQDRKEEEQKAMQLRIESMLLSKAEEELIAVLYPFVHTPRLAKRMINIYRLLRVRASIPEDEEEIDFNDFIDPEHGEYRYVLVLLAITIGYSEVAPELLEELHMAQGGNFLQWIVVARDLWADNLQLHIEEGQQSSVSGDQFNSSRKEHDLRKLKDALEEIERHLHHIDSEFKRSADRQIDGPVTSYAKWAREVGRYSFHWHLRNS